VSITPPAPADRIESEDVLDLLTSLVQRSLVVYEEDEQGHGRYRLLETVRQYARDRLLDGGEGEVVRQRHRAWFLTLAEQRPEGESETARLDRLEREHDNLRAALVWTEAQGEGELGLRLSLALWWFWNVRGHLREGREHLTGMLALPAVEARTAARAQALHLAGTLARFEGQYGTAQALSKESLAICQELGDKAGIANSILNLGGAARAQEKYGVARSLLEESLAISRELDHQEMIAQVLGQLGWVAHAQGDYGAARVLFEESLAIYRAEGATGAIPWLLNGLGVTAHAQGDDEAAQVHLAESLASFWEQRNNRGIVPGLEGLASVTAALGQVGRAARLFGAAEALREAINAPLPPADRAEHDRSVASVRTAMGDEALAAAWAEGRAMSIEAAIACALDEDTHA
jgi:non-specific serine/threonine protein kinase